ncbi:MAG: cupin domain-containing protein [Chloroflexota bacterium]
MVVLMDRKRLMRQLEAEATACYRWSNGPGDRYSAHVHDYEKILYCEEGSIVFRLEAEAREVALEAGDRMVLAAGMRHSAVVGPGGCMFVEGRR